jgi:hypothetical protein
MVPFTSWLLLELLAEWYMRPICSSKTEKKKKKKKKKKKACSENIFFPT